MASPRNWGKRSLDQENTGRVLQLDYLEPAYAAAITIVPEASETHVKPGQLTGALTLNVTVSKSKDFDKLIMYFAADGTQRIVTFGTGFLSSGTVTIPINKKAVVTAYFDGVAFHVASREISA